MVVHIHSVLNYEFHHAQNSERKGLIMSFVSSRQAAARILSKFGLVLRRDDLTTEECVRACGMTVVAQHLDADTNLELKNLLLEIVGLLLMIVCLTTCSVEKMNPLRTNRLLSTIHNVTAPPIDGGAK
jgi:hypothetical protein